MQFDTTTRIMRRTALLPLAAALTIGLSACGSDDDSSTSATPASGAASGTSSGDVSGKKVYIVSCVNSVPYCAKENQIYQSALRAKGAKVTMLLDNFSAPDAVKHLNQAVSQKADLIGYVGNAQAVARPALLKAKQAGIPVVLLGTPPESAVKGLYTSYVGPSDEDTGRTVAKLVTDTLTAAGTTQGKIATVTGTVGTVPVTERVKGWDDQLKTTPGFKTVTSVDASYDPGKATQAAQQLFAKYGKTGLNAVYAQSGPMASAVVRAAEQAGVPTGDGKGEVLLVGTTCDSTSIAAIKSGRLFATSQQGPVTDARVQVEKMIDLLAGKDVPETVPTPNDTITAANVSKYAADCDY